MKFRRKCTERSNLIVLLSIIGGLAVIALAVVAVVKLFGRSDEDEFDDWDMDMDDEDAESGCYYSVDSDIED